MKRQSAERDFGLVVRMLMVLASLFVTLSAAVAGLIVLFLVLPAYWWAWTLVAFGLSIGVVRQSLGAHDRLLETADAKAVDHDAEPELHRLVERLAAVYDMKPPALAIAHVEIPNVFSAGTSHDRSIVIVTDRMRRLLEPEELEAVIAHELAHIANRDAVVMTIASIPRLVGLELFAAETGIFLWFFLWPFGMALYLWSSLLTLALSRYREFTADTGSALATGRPETLMSALTKLSGAPIPESDLRAAQALNPLLIVSATGVSGKPVFLMDHPPLASRLRHLASIAREMGRPVA